MFCGLDQGLVAFVDAVEITDGDDAVFGVIGQIFICAMYIHYMIFVANLKNNFKVCNHVLAGGEYLSKTGEAEPLLYFN